MVAVEVAVEVAAKLFDDIGSSSVIAENRNLDREIQRLHKRKAQIARELEAAAANDLVELIY
jgi:hypothetical protein